jgi:hypothetical protein
MLTLRAVRSLRSRQGTGGRGARRLRRPSISSSRELHHRSDSQEMGRYTSAPCAK